MARRHSKKRRHSRKARRRSTRRNRYVVANARRLMRNFLGGSDVGKDIVVPVLGGTAGFLAARAFGNWLATKNLPVIGMDSRLGKLAAALVGIPVTFALAMKQKEIGKNAGAIVVGMGLAASEGYLRGTPVFGWGSPSAPPVATLPAPTEPAATAGLGAYYTEGMLGEGIDLSHAGAPYKGMLGLGEIMYAAAGLSDDQQAVEHTMNKMEAVSTVTPADVALQARFQPQVRPVSRPFTDSDQGAGLFARHLFSGMMGS